jgi:hypothetical protein
MYGIAAAFGFGGGCCKLSPVRCQEILVVERFASVAGDTLEHCITMKLPTTPSACAARHG